MSVIYPNVRGQSSAWKRHFPENFLLDMGFFLSYLWLQDEISIHTFSKTLLSEHQPSEP